MIWQELGISGGTAIIVLIALYFIVKSAVKNGVYAAMMKFSEHDDGKLLKKLFNNTSNDNNNNNNGNASK